jgi:hypothetical protein
MWFGRTNGFPNKMHGSTREESIHSECRRLISSGAGCFRATVTPASYLAINIVLFDAITWF